MEFKAIGLRFAAARKNRKLTQAQVAQSLGMSRATISGIENGTISEIGVRKLINLCDLLGLELAVEPKAARLTLHQLLREQRDD